MSPQVTTNCAACGMSRIAADTVTVNRTTCHALFTCPGCWLPLVAQLETTEIGQMIDAGARETTEELMPIILDAAANHIQQMSDDEFSKAAQRLFD